MSVRTILINPIITTLSDQEDLGWEPTSNSVKKRLDRKTRRASIKAGRGKVSE